MTGDRLWQVLSHRGVTVATAHIHTQTSIGQAAADLRALKAARLAVVVDGHIVLTRSALRQVADWKAQHRAHRWPTLAELDLHRRSAAA